MLTATKAYKQQMRKPFRNPTYAEVSIGAINQLAQQNASIPSETLYLSNNQMLFDNYIPEIEYETMERDFFQATGGMAFPERPEAVTYLFNQGAISAGILGAIEFAFDTTYDIKGLTIDFGRNYPVDFSVSNGTVSYVYTENAKSEWTTSDIFDGSSRLLITPTRMRSGEERLRIRKIYFGIGLMFYGKKLQSVKKKENVSLITEELPSMDLSVQIDNRDAAWDVNNPVSSINYLESGQKVVVRYGYQMDNGSVDWKLGGTCQLRSWKANGEQMSFDAEDRLADLAETYYGGRYYPDGVTLYALAVDVLADAKVDTREYVLDEYLKQVTVYNPLPAVSHAKCLQIIANAGRCKLYVTRDGKIAIEAAFYLELSPDRMEISSDDAAGFSDLRAVLNGETVYEYGMMTRDYFKTDGSMYFLPRTGAPYSAGFVSQEISGANEHFSHNPKIRIKLEAAGKFFSCGMNFYGNPPRQATLRSYHQGVVKEAHTVSDLQVETRIEHEFPLMDELEIEFLSAPGNNRVCLEFFSFGEQTDYIFDRLSTNGSVTGEKTEKVKDVQIIKTAYAQGVELQNIASVTADFTGLDRYTFYFSQASHGVKATLDGTTNLVVMDSGAYYATIDVSAYSGSHKVELSGYSYVQDQTVHTKVINTTGETKKWENPLVSEDAHAVLLGDWIGRYYGNNIRYAIPCRGEPRINAGDLAYLDNDLISGLMVQIEEYVLNFGNGLSGSVKARLAKGDG